MKIRLTLLTASYAPDSGILQRRINFRVAQLASYGAFYCAVLDMTSNEVNFIDALLLLSNCLKLQALLSIVALDQVSCS